MPISNNISLKNPNVGFYELENAFFSIDYETETLIKKNSVGSVQATYPISTSLGNSDLQNQIISLKVVGKRFEFSTNQGNANLFSLEKRTNGLKIRRFTIKDGICKFTKTTTAEYGTLIDEWVLNNNSSRIYDVNAFSVEYKNTYLTQDALVGSSFIVVNDVSGLSVGNRIILGPSSNGSYSGLTEEKVVSFIVANENKVFLESPLKSKYNSLDEIIFHTKILLFNNNSPGPFIGNGSLIILSATTGREISYDIGDEYCNITSSVYSPYLERSLISRGNQILAFNSTTFTFSRSIVMDNWLENKVGVIPVYDLACSQTTIYRLQTQSLDSNGVLYSFSGPGIYNYISTSLLPVVTTAVVNPRKRVMFGDGFDETYVNVLVTNQDGLPIENTQVRIRAVGTEGGSFLSFGSGQDISSPTDKMTDEIGMVKFLYKSGNNIDNTLQSSLVQLVVTLVAIDKEFSTNIYQKRYKKTTSYFTQIEGKTSTSHLRQLIGKTHLRPIRHVKNIGFPALRSSANLKGTLSEGYKEFYDGMKDIDWEYWARKYQENGFVGTSPINTVAHLSLRQLSNDKTNTIYFLQKKKSNSCVVYQKLLVKQGTNFLRQETIPSSTGSLHQLNLIDEIIPKPFSEKISVNTNIFLRLNNPGFAIDEDTIKLTVNGIDVTSLCSIGEDSLPSQTEVLYNPDVRFDFNERVYVKLEFYDVAEPSRNFYDIFYYFDVIADYRAPVLTTIYPSKGEVDVPIDSSISFTLQDFDNDVNPDSIKLYVNSENVSPLTLERISEGYMVIYEPDEPFFYTQDISICVTCEDVEGNEMISNYHFLTEPSSKPDVVEISPKNCSFLQHRDVPTIFEIYSTGDGIDRNTIRVNIDGKQRRFLVSPIIRRIM